MPVAVPQQPVPGTIPLVATGTNLAWTPEQSAIKWGGKEKAGTYLSAASALTKAGMGE